MATVIQSGRAVVAILGFQTDSDEVSFAGTGFFVGRERHLVTAEHVVRGYASFGISASPEYKVYEASLVKVDRGRDVAVLSARGYDPKVELELAEEGQIIFNQQVFSMEFSQTQLRGDHLYFSPAIRLGNVTRTIDLDDRFGIAGKDMLELSFPALRGASGAPVAHAVSSLIYGMVIANASYELLPAQIETVLDEKNQILEQTRFLLPQGVAVNAKHIKAVLNSL